MPLVRVLARILFAGAILAVAATGCGGDSGPKPDGLSDPGDLRGRTIGVSSLAGTFTLETRYVLQQVYGLDMAVNGGDVTMREATADSLPDLLGGGEVDAVVVPPLTAYRLLEEGDYAVFMHVTEEMRRLTGDPVMSTVLATYPDVAGRKAEALREVNRVLAESMTYFRANQNQVIDDVGRSHAVDPQFLRWWWTSHDLPLGENSSSIQEQLRDVWKAGLDLGDIDAYPDDSSAFFSSEDPQGGASGQGDRTTVSLAMTDDPARRVALYAIERGIVSSDRVDLDITYLPASAIADAASARQYDVIEVPSLVVPGGAARNLTFVVLSAGMQDRDGALLFVRSRPR